MSEQNEKAEWGSRFYGVGGKITCPFLVAQKKSWLSISQLPFTTIILYIQ